MQKSQVLLGLVFLDVMSRLWEVKGILNEIIRVWEKSSRNLSVVFNRTRQKLASY